MERSVGILFPETLAWTVPRAFEKKIDRVEEPAGSRCILSDSWILIVFSGFSFYERYVRAYIDSYRLVYAFVQLIPNAHSSYVYLKQRMSTSRDNVSPASISSSSVCAECSTSVGSSTMSHLAVLRVALCNRGHQRV